MAIKLSKNPVTKAADDGTVVPFEPTKKTTPAKAKAAPVEKPVKPAKAAPPAKPAKAAPPAKAVAKDETLPKGRSVDPESLSSKIKALIKKGRTNEQIREELDLPDSKKTYPQWYRTRMKKAGEI